MQNSARNWEISSVIVCLNFSRLWQPPQMFVKKHTDHFRQSAKICINIIEIIKKGNVMFPHFLSTDINSSELYHKLSLQK